MEGHILIWNFKDFTLVVGTHGMQHRVTGTQTPKGVFSGGPFAMTLEKPES